MTKRARCQRPHRKPVPFAERTIAGVSLCSDCLGLLSPRAGGEVAKLHEIRTTAIGHRVPCCLCRGTCALEDEAGRPFPCVCTSGGRELANGIPDRVVLARLVAAGFLEA